MAANNLRAVSLRRVLPSASFIGTGDIAASSATDHHAQCRPGDVFVAVPGNKRDGRDYVPAAVAAGAVAVLTDRPLLDVDVPQCVVPDVRNAYSRVCLALAGHPDRLLAPIGVTGTNGKTTVTWLLRSIFEAAGNRVGLVGTVEYATGRSSTPATLTTPGPATLTELLRRMVREGASRALIELSSHALDQSRLGGLSLSAAVVTNVTQDHFDYHGDADGYLSAKQRIADHCASGVPIVANADDPGSARLIERWHDRRVVPFGLTSKTDARATLLSSEPGRQHVRFDVLGHSFECEVRLPGRHNVSNSLAAATTALVSGLPVRAVVDGLNRMTAVPGRMQPVELGQGFRVYIDYAHTPDALAHAVETLRPTTRGRMFCVFGAGGDRDSLKRPMLGAAASAADVVVITSDNPRNEKPEAIIDQVRRGVVGTDCHVEVDRGEAIGWAISRAQEGDCVLIAGKGHERSQQIGLTQLPFSDCDVAVDAIHQHHEVLLSGKTRSGVTPWTP